MKRLKTADKEATGLKSTSQLLTYHKNALMGENPRSRSKSPLDKKKDKPQPFIFENELNVLMMIGEIYQRLHEKMVEQAKTQGKVGYGQEHQEMLKAYELVLKQRGIDSGSDRYIYKRMMKVDLLKQKGLNVFDVLQVLMDKASLKKKALDHHERALKEKAYFTLVKNMVSQVQVIPSRNYQEQGASSNPPQFATVISTSTNSCTIQQNQLKTSNTASSQNVMSGKENKINIAANIQAKVTEVVKRSSKSKSKKHKIRQPLTAVNQDINIGMESNKVYNTLFTMNSHSINPQTINKSVSQLSLLVPPLSQQTNSSIAQNQDSLIHLSNFKLLLRCVRLWRQWVNDSKSQRKQVRDTFLQNSAIAIHYHQQTLLNKSMLAFQKNTKLNQRRKLCYRIINRRSQNHLKRLCLETLSDYRRISRVRKARIFKAMNVWSEKTAIKVINQWREIVTQIRERRDCLYIKMINKPMALQCLTALAGIQIDQSQKDEPIQQRIMRVTIQNAIKKQCFLNLKASMIRDGVMIRKIHMRFIFRGIKKYLLKKSNIQKTGNKLKTSHEIKNKLCVFKRWAQNYNLLKVEKENCLKSFKFYNSSLLIKGWNSLLKNLQAVHFSQSQLKQSINTRLNKQIEQCFIGWRFVSIYNRKNRVAANYIKSRQISKQVSQSFYCWIEIALKLSKARTFHETSLQKRVITAFLLYIQQKSLKEERLSSLKFFHQIKLSRQVLHLWRVVAAKKQRERVLRLSIGKYYREHMLKKAMNAFQLGVIIQKGNRQVQQEARTYIQRRKLQLVIAHMRELTESSIKIKVAFTKVASKRILKIKQQLFDLWYQNHLRKTSLQSREMKVMVRHKKKLQSHYLHNWIVLSKLQSQRKTNFEAMRIRNSLKSVFIVLNEYRMEKNQFRTNLHKLLRFRATNIIREAFKSIQSYTKERSLKIKLNKVAKYIFLRRVLLGCFERIKAHTKRYRSFKTVKKAIEQNLAFKALRRWKVEYLRTDISKTLLLRRNTALAFKCFHHLKSYGKLHKRLNTASKQIQYTYHQQLLTKAFQGLRQYGPLHLKALALSQLVSDYLQKRLLRKYYDRLSRYNIYRKEKLTQMRIVFRGHMTRIIFRFFAQLRYMAQKSHSKKYIVKPMVERRDLQIKGKCFRVIHSYAYLKQKARQRNNKAVRYLEKSLKSKGLQVLQWYVGYARVMRIKHRASTLFDRQRLLRKSLYAFQRTKLLGTYERHVIASSCLNKKHLFLYHWYQLFIERQGQKTLYDIADKHYLRKVFSQFLGSFALFRVTERYRRSQLKLAHSYRQRSLKERMFSVFKSFYIRFREKITLVRFAQRKYLSKFFNAWLDSRPLIKASFLRYRKSLFFRREHLLKYGFIHMAIVVKSLHHYTLKIKYLRKLSIFNRLKAGYKALVQNAVNQQNIRRVLKAKRHLFAKLKLREPFTMWNNWLVLQRQEDHAKWFRDSIWPKHILQSCLTALKLNCNKAQITKYRVQTIELSVKLGRKHRLFHYMLNETKRTRVLQERLEGFQKSFKIKQLKTYFFGMLRKVLEKKGSQNVKEQAILIRQGNLLRKGFLGMQCYHQKRQSIRYLRDLRRFNRAKTHFSQWQKLAKQLQSCRTLFVTLNSVLNKNLQAYAIGLLQQHAHSKQLIEKIQSSRVSRRFLLFFNILRKKMIQARIVRTFQQQRDNYYKRIAIKALEEHRDNRVQHQSVLELQISSFLDQSSQEIVQCAFTSLQINAKNKRLQKVAQIKYAQTLLRKGFIALALVSQQSKVHQYAMMDMELRVKARFLLLWMEARENQRSSEAAKKIVGRNKIGRVLLAWRYQVEKNQVAQIFYENAFKSRIIPMAFLKLKQYCEKSKFLKAIAREIRENRRFSMIKESYLKWFDYMNLRKIEQNMSRYYQFKILKQVVDAWKQLQLLNSQKRRAKIDIRRVLKHKPQLSKPLFVLRNPKLFNYFQLFKLAIQNNRQQQGLKTKASLAFYLRLLRKSFESLRLHTLNAQQSRSVYLVRNLFRLRRFFRGLKKATNQSRWMKQARIESCVFNFLSIQRKGFNAFVINCSNRKQERMKIMLANEIYFKGLAIKVFSALQSIKPQSKRRIGSTGRIPDHFMLNCDIAQFDNQNMISPMSPLLLEESMIKPDIMQPMTTKLYCGGPCSVPEEDQTFPLSAGATTALNEGCDTTQMMMGGMMMSTACNAMVLTNNYGGYSTQQQVVTPTTQMIDLIDRKELVRELYQKKLTFKCFIGWMQLVQDRNNGGNDAHHE